VWTIMRRYITALAAVFGFGLTFTVNCAALPSSENAEDAVLPPMVVVPYAPLPDANPTADQTTLEKEDFAASGKWDLANPLRGQPGTAITLSARGTPNGLTLRVSDMGWFPNWSLGTGEKGARRALRGLWRLLHAPIQFPVTDRLAQMRDFYILGTRQIGDGASQFQDAVISAVRQAETIHRLLH
jgi:hypothetical protein